MTATATQETRAFQTEVKQLLDLMIHSLYSNKEIFLRELISNASDAADRLRFEAATDDALYEGDSDLHVYIEVDKDARTITVRDNGIGMSRDEVIENIGTIARSGAMANMYWKPWKKTHVVRKSHCICARMPMNFWRPSG